MIPRIKKLEADDYIRLNFGYKWMVTGTYGMDVTYTFRQALAYWFWHCGVPGKYCFKNKKKNDMKLNFVKLANRWYIQMPDYTDGVDDLELTGGTDEFCEKLDESGCGIVTTIVRDKPFRKMRNIIVLELDKIDENYGGANYKCAEMKMDVWLCDSTKYIFGQFPKTIFLKVVAW